MHPTTSGRPPAAESRPLLVVVSPGPEQFRGYLLASLAREYRVHLITTVEPAGELRHVTGVDVVPDYAFATVLAAVRRRHEVDPVAAVLSWDEARIVLAARVAQVLGLRGGDVAAVERCRDKHATRRHLAAAGVPQPRSVLVGSPAQALDAAAEIGYPVVLKPRGAAASRGVVRVGDEQELLAHFDFAEQGTVPDAVPYASLVLVEEYVRGDEVSIDSVVADGEVVPLFVARKQTGFAPYFEETGHLVTHPSPLLEDPVLVDVVRRTHAALGLRHGWTHTEVMLTATGPKVIEVNGRVGGDLVPYLGQLASGIEPGLVLAAALCGRPLPLAPRRSGTAGIRFGYPPASGTATEVRFDVGALPEHVDRAEVLAAPGTHVALDPADLLGARVALVTAVAPTEPECRDALDRAHDALQVRVAQVQPV